MTQLWITIEEGYTAMFLYGLTEDCH